MAAAFGVRLLGAAMVVNSNYTTLAGEKERRVLCPQKSIESESTTKAAPSDTAGKLR
jgi:hypothetical protein